MYSLDYTVDPAALAQVLIEDRLREAGSVRLARRLRRQEPTAARSARPLRRRFRLAHLRHVRRAYS